MARGRSRLLTLVWDVPGAGALTLRELTPELLAAIDREFPGARTAGDWHRSWVWSAIARGRREAFVLTRDAVSVATWCAKDRLLDLPDGRYYRLDYLEVRGDLRGGTVGAFTLAIIASRAREPGAQAIVLAAFPIEGLKAAYLRAGAVERDPTGWNRPRGLLALVFESAALTELEGLADGLVEEPQA